MKNAQGATARVLGRFGFWRGGFRRVGLLNVGGSFVLMVLVLLIKPTGLTGRAA